MRHTYRLTDETYKTLSGNVTRIAEEMDTDTSYIYQILSNAETDVFAKFKHIYAAAVRAGAPFCHWDNALEAIRARYMKLSSGKTTFECLSGKLKAHNETILCLYAALEDGHLSEHEIASIQALIHKEIEELTRFNLQLSVDRGEAHKNGNGARV